MKREVEFVFADVVSKGIHDLTALLIPDIRIALDEDYGALFANLAGAPAEILVEFMLQEAMHVVATVFLLHHHQRGVLREGF